MRVISKKALIEFWGRYPNAKLALETWYTIVSKTNFACFADIKKSFNTVDYTQPFTIFDINGNNYRLLVAIHYNTQIIYIRKIMTHIEYDKWNKTRK